MPNLSNFIDFSSDAVFLASAFIIFFALALYFGRGRMISIILAFYPSALLYNDFPFISKLLFLTGNKPEVINKIGIFLVFLIPLSIIINKFIYSETTFGGSLNFLRNMGIGLSLVILMLVFSYGTINFDILHNFSSQIDSLFGTSAYIFYWSLSPFAILSAL